MSVLFQALNRAARNHADQRVASGLPFLALSDRPCFLTKICVFGLMALGFFAGAAFVYFRLPDPPIIQAEHKILAVPPVALSDLSDGIKLSGVRNEISDKDTQAVIDKIKGLPRAGSVKNEKPVITVKESEDENTSLKEADKLLASGLSKQALVIYRELYKKNSANSTLVENYIIALAGLGEKKAKPEILRVLKDHPENAEIHAVYSKLISESSPIEAKKHLEKALELDQNNNFYRLGIGVLCDHLGNNECALQYYREALDKKNDEKSSASISWEPVEQRVHFLEGN